MARFAGWGAAGIVFALFASPAAAAGPPLLTSTSASCAMPNHVAVAPSTPLSTLSPGHGNYLYSLTSTDMVGSVTSTWGSQSKQIEYFSGGDTIWGDTNDGSLNILCTRASGTADVRYYAIPSLALGSPVTFTGTLSPGDSCRDYPSCPPTPAGQPASDSAFELIDEDYNPGAGRASSPASADAQPLYTESVIVSPGGALADTTGTLSDGQVGALISAGSEPIGLTPPFDYAVVGVAPVQFIYSLTITETGCPAGYRYQSGGSSPMNACVPSHPRPSAPRSVIRKMRSYLQARFADGFAYRAPISVTCTRAAPRRYECSWLVGGTGPGAYRDDVGGRGEVIVRGRKLVVRHVVITCSPDGRHDVCF